MKYVAFLRGVNVGGRVVKMADLKKCFEDMGFSEVRTVLQTGNVQFENDGLDHTAAIKQRLQKQFGFAINVQLVKLAELTKIVESYPFKETDDKFQNYVIFLENQLDVRLAKEAIALDVSTEAIQPGKSVIYWQVLKGWTVKSPFSKYLVMPAYKDFNTTRNIKTLRKIINV